MGNIFGRKYIFDFGLLDKIIQGSLFIFPFLNLKHLVNPFWGIVAKHIEARLTLILLLIHPIKYLVFIISLFLDASFNFHGHFFIFLTKFNYFFLYLGMNIEAFYITPPTINLFIEINCLLFYCWLYSKIKNIQIFNEPLWFHLLNSKIIKQGGHNC